VGLLFVTRDPLKRFVGLAIWHHDGHHGHHRQVGHLVVEVDVDDGSVDMLAGGGAERKWGR